LWDLLFVFVFFFVQSFFYLSFFSIFFDIIVSFFLYFFIFFSYFFCNFKKVQLRIFRNQRSNLFKDQEKVKGPPFFLVLKIPYLSKALCVVWNFLFFAVIQRLEFRENINLKIFSRQNTYRYIHKTIEKKSTKMMNHY